MKVLLIIVAILLQQSELKAENMEASITDFVKINIIIDTPPYPIGHLQMLNLTQYVGQPIDSLLTHLNIPYSATRVGSCRLQYACYLPVFFPNTLPFMQIWVGDVIHQPHFSQNGIWDISLFKKEIITKIKLFDENSEEVPLLY